MEWGYVGPTGPAHWGTLSPEYAPCAEGVQQSPVDITGYEREAVEIYKALDARAGALPGPHSDPFDRMLIAQALSRNLTVVSVDSVFDRYGVRRLW